MKRFAIILITILLLINSVYAVSDEDVKEVLKKSLFEFFENPHDTTIDIDETKDLLEFYLKTPKGEVLVDVNERGSHSGEKISDIFSDALIRFQEVEEEELAERIENRECSVGWKCMTRFHKGYQDIRCNWKSTKIFCEYGCKDGKCKPIPINITKKCWDSDGGKNYYVKGIATANGQSLSDYCNENGTLTEKYCYNDQVKWLTYNCPLGCEDGACIEKPNECELEGGRCVAPYTAVEVGTCYSNEKYMSNLLCPDQGWCCIPVKNETNCTDSDNGIDYHTRGTTGYYKPGYETRDYMDHCDGEILLEYYCSEAGVVSEKEYQCPFGCVDGACIE